MVIFFGLVRGRVLLGRAVLAIHGGVRWKGHVSGGRQSPFECGFVAKMPSRPPLSLQFFLIALIFLIFDIELILLFPALSGARRLRGRKAMALLVFLVVIAYSTLLEWSQRILEWVK